MKIAFKSCPKCRTGDMQLRRDELDDTHYWSCIQCGCCISNEEMARHLNRLEREKEEKMATQTEIKEKVDEAMAGDSGGVPRKDYKDYTIDEKKQIAREAEAGDRGEVADKYGIPRRTLWGWINVYCRGFNEAKTMPETPNPAAVGGKKKETAPSEKTAEAIAALDEEMKELGEGNHKLIPTTKEEKPEEEALPISEITKVKLELDTSQLEAKLEVIEGRVERLKGLLISGLPKFRWWWLPSVQLKWLEIYERMMSGR